TLEEGCNSGGGLLSRPRVVRGRFVLHGGRLCVVGSIWLDVVVLVIVVVDRLATLGVERRLVECVAGVSCLGVSLLAVPGAGLVEVGGRKVDVGKCFVLGHY